MPRPKKGKDSGVGQRTPESDAAAELELLALADQFAAEWRAGREPRLSDYLRRYPQHAARLTDFVAGLLTEEPEEPEEAAESGPTPLAPGTLRALDTLFAQETKHDQGQLARVAERPAKYAAGVGLLGAARAAGIDVEALAVETDLSPQVLAQLDERPLTGTQLPPALVARLGAALGLAPARVTPLLRRAGGDALSDEGLRELLTKDSSLSKEQRKRWGRQLGEQYR